MMKFLLETKAEKGTLWRELRAALCLIVTIEQRDIPFKVLYMEDGEQREPFEVIAGVIPVGADMEADVAIVLTPAVKYIIDSLRAEVPTEKIASNVKFGIGQGREKLHNYFTALNATSVVSE